MSAERAIAFGSPAKTKANKKKSASSPAKSVLQEGGDIAIASTMISLGARLQVLESETGLSYERLSRLYREIHGCSAPRGMLPFSADWFMNWRANVHSSIFFSIYQFVSNRAGVTGVSALIKAYGLYREHDEIHEGEEPTLSFTRAWMLLRFMRGGMLQMTKCTSCDMDFVTHAQQLECDFVCPVCRPPARVVGMLLKEDEKRKDLDEKNSSSKRRAHIHLA